MLKKIEPAYLCMTLAVFFISLSSFAAKLCLNNHIPVVTVIAWRFIFPLLLMMLFFAIRGIIPRLTKRGLWLCILRSVTLVFAQIALFLGMMNMPLSESVLLFAMSPIFIALYDVMFGNRKLEKEFALVLVLGAVGVIVTLYSSKYTLNIYVIAGLFSGVFAAMSQIIFHKSVQNDNSFYITFYIYFFTGIFSLLSLVGYYLIFGHAVKLFYLTSHFYKDPLFLALLMVGLASLFNQYLRGIAYKLVSNASSLAPFIYLSIVLAVLFDIFYFLVVPAFHVWVGGIIIIVSSLLLIGLKNREQKRKKVL